MCFEDIKRINYGITDSTNTKAREYVLSGGKLPALFTANGQTAGRGRHGKSFYSPTGTGLYMTLALPFDETVRNAVSLTSVAAAAVLRALSGYTEKTLSIKWVNDILADGGKAAGILCETVTRPESGDIKAVLIGIGVNLTTKEFPDGINQAVTCLSDKPTDSAQVAEDITAELLRVIYREDKAAVMDEYRSRSAVIGKDIYYIKNGQRLESLAVGIDDCGGLLVRHADGSMLTLTSGEISLRIKSD